MIRTERALAFIYVAMMIAIAVYAIPSNDQHSFLAVRYLGANTRIANTLFIRPSNLSLSGRLHLDRLQVELVGKYVKEPIAPGAAIALANLASWPDLSDDLIPVILSDEPDWMTFNEGSVVDVWKDDKLITLHGAEVQAIVQPDKNKKTWLVLLRRNDLVPDYLSDSDLAKSNSPVTVRLDGLPHRPQQPAAHKS